MLVDAIEGFGWTISNQIYLKYAGNAWQENLALSLNRQGFFDMLREGKHSVFRIHTVHTY